MKIKSVSGITCFTKNLKHSIAFYRSLGMRLGKIEPHRATGYVNWFWMELRQVDKDDSAETPKEAKLRGKGAGVSPCVSVDDADSVHRELRSKRLKPSNQPRDTPWGTREFVLRDSDGYKLVVFAKR